MLVFSSLILVAVGVAAAVTPGHRPAGGRVAARPGGPARAGRSTRRRRAPTRDRVRLRPAGGPPGDLQPAQRHAARRVHRRRPRPRRAGGRAGRQPGRPGDRPRTSSSRARRRPASRMRTAATAACRRWARATSSARSAALTGSARTADVVVTQPTTLMEVPAEALRAAMEVPEVNKLLPPRSPSGCCGPTSPTCLGSRRWTSSALRDLQREGADGRGAAEGYGEA